VSCAKTDELIEVPFGMWTQMGSKNPVLGGVGSLKERGNLGTYFTMEYLACDILNLFGRWQ